MRKFSKMAMATLFCVCVAAIGGAAATWSYATAPGQPQQHGMGLAMLTQFTYGQIYIMNTEISGGDYLAAEVDKSTDTAISVDLQLSNVATSTMSVEVMFYNNANINYYYNKAESLSWDNEAVVYAVTGIEQGELIAPQAYKELTVEFSYRNGTVADASLLGELNFLFTIDKDDFDEVVANTALERFEDIINNEYKEDSYTTLSNAMSSRGSAFNKSSAVTYIGNVAGADDTDSAVLNGFFSDVMNLDLDGDGNTEPVTMIIKRENLDNDLSTGDSYTYTSWGRETTVNGVEMSLYITAHDFSDSSRDVVVYVATYTKLEGSDKWTNILPSTRGTATANNYNGGWGEANSFNTDTWKADSGKTIDELLADR